MIRLTDFEELKEVVIANAMIRKKINNYEILIGKCLDCCPLRHRIFSWVKTNDKKLFYFGLTIVGVSVTIQKNKKYTGGLR